MISVLLESFDCSMFIMQVLPCPVPGFFSLGGVRIIANSDKRAFLQICWLYSFSLLPSLFPFFQAPVSIRHFHSLLIQAKDIQAFIIPPLHVRIDGSGGKHPGNLRRCRSSSSLKAQPSLTFVLFHIDFFGYTNPYFLVVLARR